jgi:hypothetical protein
MRQLGMDTDPAKDKRSAHGRRTKIAAFVRRNLDDARQLGQPGPFRIWELPEPAASGEPLGQPPAPTAGNSGGAAEADLRQSLQTLAAVATALRRVRAKLVPESKAELPPELRHLPRHIEAAWDALVAGHVEVQDPSGQAYVPGMAVNAIAFQPMQGVGAEVIHETIKPCVYYKDTLVQRADVIVAQPLDSGTKLSTQPASPASRSEPVPPVGSTATDPSTDQQ